MSGGQDFNPAELAADLDALQARLAGGPERRRVVDGLCLNMKADDFRVPPKHLADAVIRALIVADYQHISLAEVLLERIQEAG